MPSVTECNGIEMHFSICYSLLVIFSIFKYNSGEQKHAKFFVGVQNVNCFPRLH